MKFYLLNLVLKHKKLYHFLSDNVYVTTQETTDRRSVESESNLLTYFNYNSSIQENIKLLISDYTILNTSFSPVPGIIIHGEEYVIGKYKQKQLKEEVTFLLSNLDEFYSKYDNSKLFQMHKINYFNVYKVIQNNKKFLSSNSLLLFDKRIFKVK